MKWVDPLFQFNGLSIFLYHGAGAEPLYFYTLEKALVWLWLTLVAQPANRRPLAKSGIAQKGRAHRYKKDWIYELRQPIRFFFKQF